MTDHRLFISFGYLADYGPTLLADAQCNELYWLYRVFGCQWNKRQVQTEVQFVSRRILGSW